MKTKLKFYGLLWLGLISATSFSEELAETISPRGKSSPLHGSLELHYGRTSLPSYEWLPGETASSAKIHQLKLRAAWLPFAGPGGKWEVGIGVGYLFAADVGLSEGRLANLEVFPIELSTSYHFDYFDDQFLVPYARIGTEFAFTNQRSKTGANVTGMRMYYGLNYSLGAQLCLNAIDGDTADWFDRSLGVNGTYLVVEYLNSIFLARPTTPDLTRKQWTAALRFEY